MCMLGEETAIYFLDGITIKMRRDKQLYIWLCTTFKILSCHRPKRFREVSHVNIWIKCVLSLGNNKYKLPKMEWFVFFWGLAKSLVWADWIKQNWVSGIDRKGGQK
jgi:hypothetical protein